MDTVRSQSGQAQPATPARFSVLRSGTTISGSILAVAHGIILAHFFGVAVGVVWSVVAVALLVVLVHQALVAATGDRKAGVRFNNLQLALVTFWMASTVAGIRPGRA